MGSVSEGVKEKDWYDIRDGLHNILEYSPELKKEYETLGYLKLHEYGGNSSNIPYDFAKALEGFLRQKQNYISTNYPNLKLPAIKGGELVEWLLDISSKDKQQLFWDFLESQSLIFNFEGYLTGEEFNQIDDMTISSELLGKLLEYFSQKTYPESVEYLMQSDNGVIYPVSNLPEIFRDCYGEYGVGTIYIQNVIKYSYDLVNSIFYTEWDFNTHTEVYSLFVGSMLNSPYSYPIELCVPKNGDKQWSKAKKLPNNLSHRLNLHLSEKLASVNIGTPVICKLHMNGDVPVLSFNDKSETNAKGLTKILLSAFTMPIKEVYFIIPEYKYNGCDSVIAKKNPDGEYTLTIY